MLQCARPSLPRAECECLLPSPAEARAGVGGRTPDGRLAGAGSQLGGLSDPGAGGSLWARSHPALPAAELWFGQSVLAVSGEGATAHAPGPATPAPRSVCRKPAGADQG